jgi:hypothetical protein
VLRFRRSRKATADDLPSCNHLLIVRGDTSALAAATESGRPAASARSAASRRSAVRLDGRAT